LRKSLLSNEKKKVFTFFIHALKGTADSLSNKKNQKRTTAYGLHFIMRGEL
jgi:hypothetical protein